MPSPRQGHTFEKGQKIRELEQVGGGGAPLGVRGRWCGGWARSTVGGGVRATMAGPRPNYYRERVTGSRRPGSPDRSLPGTNQAPGTLDTGQRSAALGPSVATNTGNETPPRPGKHRTLVPMANWQGDCHYLAMLTDRRAPGESSRALNSSPGLGWVGRVNVAGG